MPEYKQAIVIRTDLGMSKGKMIAQACHASLGSFKKAGRSTIGAWEEKGQTKVVLRVESDSELHERKQQADQNGLPAFLVTDAGRTELDPGTTTCLGIGPAETAQVDAVTGDLEPV
ncbi:MAG: peptidyl-tRNA hydrolase Pth2 [Candidatus Nanohaloarchaea archaeon]|nr:peptidyl-tRNA hydrolase Pth2 [Candidatus Nanohaloarchaea archaeon]